jgi:hypothetical protein
MHHRTTSSDSARPSQIRTFAGDARCRGAARSLRATAPRTGRRQDAARLRVRRAVEHGRLGFEREGHRAVPAVCGAGEAAAAVKFCYNIGREDKLQSNGWVALQPVDNVVGPELSFAREVSRYTKAPIAIIKCRRRRHASGWRLESRRAAGLTMYPLALKLVREALADLDRRKIRYRLEGFVWHQGENDMFDGAMPAYGKNLRTSSPAGGATSERRSCASISANCARRRSGAWTAFEHVCDQCGPARGDRGRSVGEYVPTSHVGVEIGGGAGLHYHYGTLGQLEHGVNYAHAYLRTIGKEPQAARARWPIGRTRRAARSSCSCSPGIATWKGSGRLCRTSKRGCVWVRCARTKRRSRSATASVVATRSPMAGSRSVPRASYDTSDRN